jgi:hypothetical protein
MQYFDKTDDNATRTGKVIGDAFAALVYLSVIWLMAAPLMR